MGKITPFPAFLSGPDFEDDLLQFREELETELQKPGWTLIGYRYEKQMREAWGLYRRRRGGEAAPDIHLFTFQIDYENDSLIPKGERRKIPPGFQEAGFIPYAGATGAGQDEPFPS